MRDRPYIAAVPPPASNAALSGSDAIAALLVSSSLFLLAGPGLASWGMAGMVATELLAFAMPALLLAATRRQGMAALGIVRCSWWIFLGTLLIGVSLWYWNLAWVAPIGEGWSAPNDQRIWESFVAVESRSLWATLFLFALVPAVCEELLHRGILAPSLARHLGTGPAILISGLLFGLAHLSLSRLLPTAVLGTAAAFVRLRSGSLWPAMLLHFLYNACLLIAAQGRWNLPASLAIPGLLISGCGLILVYKGPKSLPSSKGKANHTIVKN